MEVGSIAGQNNNGAWRIGFQLVSVELIAQSDVEDAGNDCVDPILAVLMWHQLHTVGHFDSDRVRPLLRGLTYNNSQTHRWRERRERLPVDVF